MHHSPPPFSLHGYARLLGSHFIINTNPSTLPGFWSGVRGIRVSAIFLSQNCFFYHLEIYWICGSVIFTQFKSIFVCKQIDALFEHQSGMNFFQSGMKIFGPPLRLLLPKANSWFVIHNKFSVFFLVRHPVALCRSINSSC